MDDHGTTLDLPVRHVSRMVRSPELSPLFQEKAHTEDRVWHLGHRVQQIMKTFCSPILPSRLGGCGSSFLGCGPY